TVHDNQAPTITLNGSNPMTVECHTSFTDPGATAHDICDGDFPATASGTVNVNVPGSYTITYNATDSSGNAAAPVTRTVNVVDTQAPTITLNGANPMTVECHTTFTDPGATASDGCAGDLTSSISVSGSVNSNVVGSYTLTYSVSDGNGHTTTATRTVNVVDTQAPTITLNGANPMTVECHTSFSDPGAVAHDACGGDFAATASGSVNANVPGDYTITYNASDASGNAATPVTRTVHVVDTTRPVITLNGSSSVTIECHSSYTDAGATASDGCAGDLTSSIVVTGSVNPNVAGDYTLSFNVSDPSGNAAITVTRVVHVVDHTAPTITLNGSSSVTVECHTSFTDPGAVAHDACAGDFPATASGTVNINQPGDYTITYTATDPSGNSATPVTRVVHVRDTIKPTITLNGPNPMTVECHSTFTDPGATATDGCAGDISGSIVRTGSVNTNQPGTYTLTYNVSDPSGNAATTVTRTVIVVDSTGPVITLNGQSHSMWPPNHKYETFNVTDFVASVSDSCNTTISVSSVVISKVTSDETENGNGDGNTLNDIVIAPGCKSVQLRSERDGGGNGRVYTITFKVTDSNGNVGTVTAKVTVPANQGGGAAVDDGPHYTVTCP
ncbi:MAG TPA: DUF5011 domain-containing protein, partial [Pyrinomonadaceae bacterium]|nr:DUF5011 domain-containing protein [Pyrinomonadaceae bacterium]